MVRAGADVREQAGTEMDRMSLNTSPGFCETCQANVRAGHGTLVLMPSGASVVRCTQSAARGAVPLNLDDDEEKLSKALARLDALSSLLPIDQRGAFFGGVMSTLHEIEIMDEVTQAIFAARVKTAYAKYARPVGRRPKTK